MMKKIAFFDTKPYDRTWFEKLNPGYEFDFFEDRLSPKTARLAEGCDAVCAFVNDDLGRETLDLLAGYGITLVVLRCAGYNNVDFKSAYGRIHVLRVPAYSPYAVAEHAFALLTTLNRKIHKAYLRTRDFNFSLVNLNGMDLHGKTAGVIGTGRIGRVFIDICRGYGMHVIAYDSYPAKDSGIEYVDLPTLFSRSDIISLHCPLTDGTHHILNADAFRQMKDGVFIINTSRGALIDSAALLDALNSGKVRGAGLDVYEEESEYFYEDCSNKIITDDVLALLISKPNVIITSHQAFLTDEALQNIARTTLDNLNAYFEGKELVNEVCYQCSGRGDKKNCQKAKIGKCF